MTVLEKMTKNDKESTEDVHYIAFSVVEMADFMEISMTRVNVSKIRNLEYHKQVHRNPHFLQRIKHRRQRLYDMKDPKWALEEKTKERHHMKDRNFGPKMSLHSEHHARRQPSRKNNTPDEMLCKRLPHANRKCPDFKREVCGSDGVTYHNYCEFLREMCK